MRRSWFFQNGLFYTLLAFVLLLHLILLAIRYQQNLDLTQVQPEAPLKVRILREHERHKKQIVQSEDPSTEETPEEAAYLSDKNRKVDRHSRARRVDSFHKGAKGGGEAASKNLKLSDLGAFDKSHHPLKDAVAKKTQKSPGQSASTVPDRSVSSTNDFIEEVPLGDLTYLNTVEYKYYGFYHRIRQKLEQFWGRSIQEKAETFMKEGRRIASDENLITSLVVTLTEEGQITDIIIKGSSGIKELDDAAVESFNAAGPFPNPPKGLLQNGKVQIEWGFVVDT